MKDTKGEKIELAETETETVEQTDVDTEDNSDAKKSKNNSDIDLLKGIVEKYQLTNLEKKLVSKLISLLETTKTRQMLPSQNVGDSVFKMYESDEEPTEFVVDRIEFDESGWKLISYEKFGACEIDFVFPEKDYNKYFFDTAEKAKKFQNKA